MHLLETTDKHSVNLHQLAEDETAGICVACEQSFIETDEYYLSFVASDEQVACHLTCIPPLFNAVDELHNDNQKEPTTVRGHVLHFPVKESNSSTPCFACGGVIQRNRTIILSDPIASAHIPVHVDCWEAFADDLSEHLWEGKTGELLGDLL